MGAGQLHREPEVHVVVVHSQEDGKVAAKVIKQPKNQTTGASPLGLVNK